MSDTIETAQEGLEHAHHAQHERDPTAARVAVLIATLAAALALADMAEKSAQNAYLTHHVSLSDDWAFFQAKSARATMRAVEASVLESLPGAEAPAVQGRIKAARDEEARLRDDPAGGKGAKQLAEQAARQTELRDHAFHTYHLFELVVSGLQIAIVLASISVVTRIRSLAFAGGGLGAAACVFGLLVAGGAL